tara:strand:- start:1111 stop:2217 length:1107 start_codon:yes stop_codon:yes gene_type:complete
MSKLFNKFSGARVIITGHTGFKGCWLTIWLESLGAEVFGISDNYSITTPSHFMISGIKNKINNFNADIRDFENIKKIIIKIKPDFIFHLAAQSLVKDSYKIPLDTWHTNTIGTLNILESLRFIKHKCIAILITSDKCYENFEWEFGYRENDKLGGIDPYSSSKAAAEIGISSYVRSYFLNQENIRIGIARAGNVIGGGDWAKDRIVPDCIRSCAKEEVVILRNPNSTRPWQHVLEPISGYLSMAIKLSESSKLNGESFNFGPPSNQILSVNDLIEEMAKYWEKVKWKIKDNNKNNFHEASLLKLNTDKAIKYLKWYSTWDFETTVKMTTNWYKQYYEKNKDFKKSNITKLQIEKYCEDAKNHDLFWAQ